MKEIWKVRNDSKLRQSLIFLKTPEQYITYITESDFFTRADIKNNDFFIVSRNKDTNSSSHGYFGYDKISSYKTLLRYGYKDNGVVNLRKHKLEKLNLL